MKKLNPDPKIKTLRLYGKAKTEFRRKVAERALEFCDVCGWYAPLKWDGVFDSGHVAHIKSYGAGGGDTMDNVKWKCPDCHGKEHGPQWGKGALKGHKEQG